ncbi:MAG: tRNA pseudouridine(38-40) synthase TruA [Burkholderiales bacterium]
MRIALGIEYDGTAHCGWQSQPSGCGVQDSLETAIGEIAAEKISLICAGRTDTGVHALAQVAHFDTRAQRPDTAWVRGVNALLPGSVAVQWAAPVDEEFHARFSAVSRTYTYILFNHPVRPALQAGKVGWYHAPLDVTAMHTAAQVLVGKHDFSAFRAAECQAKTAIKTINYLELEKRDEYLVLTLNANGFLHHMVRNIIGSLVCIGAGKQPAAWMQGLLLEKDRARAAPTFAPDGLYLVAIEYADKWKLPVFGKPAWFEFKAMK